MAQDMGQGIIAPDSNDSISTTGVQEMRTIAATAAAAIEQAGQTAQNEARTYTDNRVWRRGTASSGTDWNNVTTPGVWDIGPAELESMSGLPEEVIGTMEVIGSGGNQVRAFQRYTTYGNTTSRTWKRVRANVSSWANWSLETGDGGQLSANDDANGVTSPVTVVRSPGHETIANLPPNAGPGLLRTVYSKITPQHKVQEYFEYSGFQGEGRYWYRTGSSSTAWGDWHELGATGSSSGETDAGLANQLRIDDFTQRWGGVKKTGGKGVLSFRFDHGLANFNAKIRPLMEARGIPYTITLSSRHWDHSENSGVTPAMVNMWVEDGLCTISNHGADAHQDATTYDALYDQIVTGLAELRSQLPAAMIDMWHVPGVGGTGYDGFGSGNSPEAFYDTTAGQLILQHHAVSSGAFPDSQMRVLDGRIRQGQRHVTMDSASVSALTTRVNEAQNGPYGVQFMLHPSRLDETGYISTAELTQFLDLVVARRDAQDLRIMHSYDLALADAT